MSRIDLFLEATKRAFEGVGEIAPWPINIGIIFPYFTDVEAADLFAKLKLISKEEQPKRILSKLQVGPSATKALLMDLIVGLKVAKPPLTVEDRVWFVEYILSALEKMQAGDIFCRDGTNRILDSDEVGKIYDRTPWLWLGSEKSRKQLGRSIHRASASVKALIWSLYFYGWDDAGYEIHGPYEITAKGKKLRLVIADYFDPRPTLLWDSIKPFPYNSIKVMALYNWETDLEVDIFCHLTSKDNLLASTEGIYLEADGIPIRTEEGAEALGEEVRRQVLEQQKRIKVMSKKEIIQKYIECRYYAFRRWRRYFGEDWHPPVEVLRRIKEWKVIELPESGGATPAQLIKAYDPRTDFIPGQDKEGGENS